MTFGQRRANGGLADLDARRGAPSASTGRARASVCTGQSHWGTGGYERVSPRLTIAGDTREQCDMTATVFRP